MATLYKITEHDGSARLVRVDAPEPVEPEPEPEASEPGAEDPLDVPPNLRRTAKAAE